MHKNALLESIVKVLNNETMLTEANSPTVASQVANLKKYFASKPQLPVYTRSEIDKALTPADRKLGLSNESAQDVRAGDIVIDIDRTSSHYGQLALVTKSIKHRGIDLTYFSDFTKGRLEEFHWLSPGPNDKRKAALREIYEALKGNLDFKMPVVTGNTLAEKIASYLKQKPLPDYTPEELKKGLAEFESDFEVTEPGDLVVGRNGKIALVTGINKKDIDVIFVNTQKPGKMTEWDHIGVLPRHLEALDFADSINDA